MRNFVGIDISLTGTGVCRLTRDGTVGKTKCIKTLAHKSFTQWFDRIKAITDEVMEYVDNGSIVFVEGYAFGATGQVFNIAELSGYIKYQLYTGDCTAVIQVPPTSLKKYIAGKGNAKKDLMLKEVYKKYGVDFTDDNIADAFALARMAYELTRHYQNPQEHPWTDNEAAAVVGIIKDNKGGDYELFQEAATHGYVWRTRNAGRGTLRPRGNRKNAKS